MSVPVTSLTPNGMPMPKFCSVRLPHGGMLHRTYRRQLNRAHRRRIRKAAT
jgi:hypothetical protein